MRVTPSIQDISNDFGLSSPPTIDPSSGRYKDKFVSFLYDSITQLYDALNTKEAKQLSNVTKDLVNKLKEATK